jgi:PleD family two-component response regulator
MKSIKTILLVEDNPGDACLLQEMLKENETLNIELVTCMSEAETSLAAGTIDIALLDLGLPDAQGLEAIRRAHAAAPGVPLVVLTGLDDESLAAEALQLGAQDYLIKGQIETRGLLRALRYAVERKTMESVALAMARQMAHSAEHDFLTGLPNRMLLNDRIGQAIALAKRHATKSCRAVFGFGRLQAHQRFSGTPRRRQAPSIRRQASGGLHTRLGFREPARRRRIRRFAFGS